MCACDDNYQQASVVKDSGSADRRVLLFVCVCVCVRVRVRVRVRVCVYIRYYLSVDPKQELS